ncbi:hypothetical protein MPH_07936 [Macrophomina phaseolina MS6]|uniref:Uncharacterized protein n=1 Tax=Macrophomina phaseolina (strain MS6) TaxID=1126212 RepID=K2QY94_MACPH|nr:hypothetical protein MPH_07936 [Macrophomina phaseolina MS6]
MRLVHPPPKKKLKESTDERDKQQLRMHDDRLARLELRVHASPRVALPRGTTMTVTVTALMSDGITSLTARTVSSLDAVNNYGVIIRQRAAATDTESTTTSSGSVVMAASSSPSPSPSTTAAVEPASSSISTAAKAGIGAAVAVLLVLALGVFIGRRRSGNGDYQIWTGERSEYERRARHKSGRPLPPGGSGHGTYGGPNGAERVELSGTRDTLYERQGGVEERST